MKRVSIIGFGRVGRALANSFADSDYSIADIVVHNFEQIGEAKSIVKSAKVIDSLNDTSEADIYFITTQDRFIADVGSALLKTKTYRPESIVVHCSGGLTSSILSDLGLGIVCSAHPLASFAIDNHKQDQFKGVYCAIEGSDKSLEVMVSLFQSIGAIPFQIESGNKSLYHAAAVFSSNYINALYDISKKLFLTSGVPENISDPIIQSLMNCEIRNICAQGNQRALTGPIARGDIEVIECHKGALSEVDPKIAKIYMLLAEHLQKNI